MHYGESQTVAGFFISCLQFHDEEWTNGQNIPALADSATKPLLCYCSNSWYSLFTPPMGCLLMKEAKTLNLPCLLHNRCVSFLFFPEDSQIAWWCL